MKRIKWIFTLASLLALQIYSSPADNVLELTATLCHFSESGLRCSCPDEAKENLHEYEKTVRKVRQQNKESLNS